MKANQFSGIDLRPKTQEGTNRLLAQRMAQVYRVRRQAQGKGRAQTARGRRFFPDSFIAMGGCVCRTHCRTYMGR